MVASDLDIKEALLKRLNATNDELVAMIVKSFVASSRHLDIKLIIWMNAREQPWQHGVTLLEMCGRLSADDSPLFRPIEFPPQAGWPRVRTILTSKTELQFDDHLAEIAKEEPYRDKIQSKLDSGEARIVFPQGVGAEAFQQLLVIVE